LRKPEGGTKREVGNSRTPQGARKGVDVVGDAAKRDETQAGVVARTRGDREAKRRNFEEARKLERMNPARKGRGTARWSESPTVKETNPARDAVRSPDKGGTSWHIRFGKNQPQGRQHVAV